MDHLSSFSLQWIRLTLITISLISIILTISLFNQTSQKNETFLLFTGTEAEIKNSLNSSNENISEIEAEFGKIMLMIKDKITIPRFKCAKLRLMGGIWSCGCTEQCISDGYKYVCFDKEFMPHKCNVMSFGIGDDLTFDKAMTLYGCKVIAFDHTDHENSNRKHKSSLHTVTLGIGDKDQYSVFNVSFGKNHENFVINTELLTYSSMLNIFHINPNDVTILKIDIEGYEWRVLKNILNTPNLINGVKQILLEFHLNVISTKQNKTEMLKTAKDVLETLNNLDEIGFKIAHYEENQIRNPFMHFNGNNISLFSEVLYVR